MTLTLLSASLSVFVILVTVFFPVARASDRKSRRLDAISGTFAPEYDEDLERPFMERFLLPFFRSFFKRMTSIVPKGRGASAGKLERSLRLAGLALNAEEFNAARLMLAGALLLGAIFFSALPGMEPKIKVLIFFLAGILSLILPSYYLRMRVNFRREGVRRQLPDVLDLLSVAMEAGLGFDLALLKIGERLRGPLVEELLLVQNEVQLGRPRRDALRALGERSDLGELKSFTSAVIQAEHLGIPVKNVLRTQAEQLRVSRRQKAEQKAMKAPIKMMLPLVAFVFPVLFIILLGPTILQMLEQFGGG